MPCYTCAYCSTVLISKPYIAIFDKVTKYDANALLCNKTKNISYGKDKFKLKILLSLGGRNHNTVVGQEGLEELKKDLKIRESNTFFSHLRQQANSNAAFP